MANLTSTKHAELANKIAFYWQKQTDREVKAESWFMAALALGSALEAMLYGYFIIWNGDENSDPTKDGGIPDHLTLHPLLELAKRADLLSPGTFKDKFGEHAVEDVINEIQRTRNNIHAGVALRGNFDPATFTRKEFERLAEIFYAAIDNWELKL